MPRESLVVTSAANTTAYWSTPTIMSGLGADPRGLAMTFRAAASGAGAVGAVVSLYQGTAIGWAVVYDDTAAATLTLSGTALSVASQTFLPTGNHEWKAVISGITAATSVSLVASW